MFGEPRIPLLALQEHREWVDKPDGTIITMDAAKASTRALFKKPSSGVDYYELLQVPRDATPEQIKKAYYTLARRWHPGLFGGDQKRRGIWTGCFFESVEGVLWGIR